MQQHKSANPAMSNGLIEVKKPFPIDKCMIETCTEQNLKLKTVNEYPVINSKHQGGTFKIYQHQPSDDLKVCKIIGTSILSTCMCDFRQILLKR